MSCSEPASGAAGGLPKSLQETLLDVHQHPYPHVPNPPGCKKRASVALIIRIRPHHAHWPDESAPDSPGSSSTRIPVQLNDFFSQPWVENGDPEVLFIKRASRVGDMWTGHVALPGGKRDPEDEDDRAVAVRETSEEIGLDLANNNVICAGNLPERVVTTSWGSVPLMVLCPFIFILTSKDVPLLKLQPTEVASVNWVSLRALLSPSMRTVEYVDISQRLARRGGFLSRATLRLLLGRMMFSAVKLIPTESLQCSSIPGFIPGDQTRPAMEKPSLFQRWKSWYLSGQAESSERNRSLLLWGLTLGIMSDLLEMLPPHNAVELWQHPTFTRPDLRWIISIMTYRLRTRNRQHLEASRKSSGSLPVAVHGETNHGPNEVGMGGLGVGRYYGPPSQGSEYQGKSYAVGLLLNGYYPQIRKAILVFLALRGLVGTGIVVYLVRWFRRR